MRKRGSVVTNRAGEEGLFSDFLGAEHPQRVTEQPGGLCYVKSPNVLPGLWDDTQTLVSPIVDLPPFGPEKLAVVPVNDVDSSRILSPPLGWKSFDDKNPLFFLFSCLLTPPGIPS